jgi:murein DD-endopeptidase MepM/ murein hydrolase activator NlpD
MWSSARLRGPDRERVVVTLSHLVGKCLPAPLPRNRMNRQLGGHTMSSLPRRAGLVVAVVAAAIGLNLAAPHADAATPETIVSTSPQRADARDRALVGRTAVLAQYGYTGDPDAVQAVLPLASYRLSAGFGLTGPLWEAEHGGQDFSTYAGDQIVAIAAGEVTEVAYAGPYGLRTVVTLPDGTEVWYCHQTDVSVYAGQTVDVADPIGTVGSTGNTTGPHLHLEIRPDAGSPIDPVDWLRTAGLNP